MSAMLTFQELVLETMQLGLNKDQNAQVTPNIFSVATRLSTDWLLDEISRIFPFNERIVDKARPFLKRKLVSVVDGIAVFPEDYRNILEIRIATNKNQTEGCNCGEEIDECDKIDDHCTPVEKAPIRKEKCYFVKVNILDQDQFADASQSDLYPPTLKMPIGTFVNRTEFKICPIEGITYIELVYLKQPLFYNIGFNIMPDDTWQINPATTIEPEWERNANPDLFKYITTLLALHTRDGNFLQAFNELKKVGMS
jgi:hypothetical protein